MAVTYSYVVSAVRVGSQGSLVDVVKEIEANVTGVDGSAAFNLPVTVAVGDADPDNFTSYDSLTEGQIISWMEANPALEGIKAHIAIVVEKEVAKLALEQKPLPWAPPAIEPAAISE